MAKPSSKLPPDKVTIAGARAITARMKEVPARPTMRALIGELEDVLGGGCELAPVPPHHIGDAN